MEHTPKRPVRDRIVRGFTGTSAVLLALIAVSNFRGGVGNNRNHEPVVIMPGKCTVRVDPTSHEELRLTYDADGRLSGLRLSPELEMLSQRLTDRQAQIELGLEGLCEGEPNMPLAAYEVRFAVVDQDGQRETVVQPIALGTNSRGEMIAAIQDFHFADKPANPEWKFITRTATIGNSPTVLPR